VRERGGNKRTFPPAIKLHRDPLVHVLLQVQNVLLLRPLLVLALSLSAVGTPCAAAPASSSSTPATAASRTTVPAAVGSVCHCCAGFEMGDWSFRAIVGGAGDNSGRLYVVDLWGIGLVCSFVRSSPVVVGLVDQTRHSWIVRCQILGVGREQTDPTIVEQPDVLAAVSGGWGPQRDLSSPSFQPFLAGSAPCDAGVENTMWSVLLNN
jgi:hypothetical protein